MKKNSPLHKLINKFVKPVDLTKNNLEGNFYLRTSLTGSAYDSIHCVSSFENINYPENATENDKSKLDAMYNKLSKINLAIHMNYSFKNKVLKDNYHSSSNMLNKMKCKQEHTIKMFKNEINEKSL